MSHLPAIDTAIAQVLESVSELSPSAAVMVLQRCIDICSAVQISRTTGEPISFHMDLDLIEQTPGLGPVLATLLEIEPGDFIAAGAVAQAALRTRLLEPVSAPIC